MLQKPRGTRDFLPAEMAQRRHIERRMRTIAQSFGYGEIQTPMFEEQELFTLKSGEGIIGEMYAFEDKGGRKIALRPEVTAAVVRAYVNEAQVAPKPLRWYYFAECFRYERPQKGRYRQFWQFGCELIGADSAAADAEVIALAYELLKSSGVRFVLNLKIGHLAPMKHMLRDLDAGEQKKVMAALDKRDMDLLKTTLDAIEHPDLYEPLTTLITAETLDQVWQVTGDIPEKSRIEETFPSTRSGRSQETSRKNPASKKPSATSPPRTSRSFRTSASPAVLTTTPAWSSKERKTRSSAAVCTVLHTSSAEKTSPAADLPSALTASWSPWAKSPPTPHPSSPSSQPPRPEQPPTPQPPHSAAQASPSSWTSWTAASEPRSLQPSNPAQPTPHSSAKKKPPQAPSPSKTSNKPHNKR